jgi:hypothetical protein
MSIRYNEVNNGGIVTVSGGNMPVQNYTNQRMPLTRTNANGNTVAAITVISNGHAVEVDGDGGLWDTVSGATVLHDLTTAGCINI